MVNEGIVSERHYPVRCPACGAFLGYPTIVRTILSKPGHIRIEISCQSCKEQWFHDVDTDGR